jgi:epidermal growth factor receptor substrate 15
MTTSVDDRVVAMSVLLAPSGGTYTGGLTGTSTTQAGATLATHTPRTSGSAATSTIRYVLTDAAVTTGGTGAPTYAGTATGANAAGSTAFVVIREVANVAPTATITANQNVAASASVSATMTASDSDGTIASYSWTGTRYSTTAEPTAITLTGATTATASYTASASTGVLDVLTCVATDNGGLTVTKTTEVRVPTTGDITTLRGPGTGGTWTNTGGAASEGAAIADASNTTYLESPVLTTTETTKRLRLAPAASRVALTLTTTVSQDVAGTISAKVRLFEGSTLRQESALTTTTSAADQVFSITSGAIAAVTDWGNLYLEWAGTA